METTLAKAIREYRATGNLDTGLQAGRKLIQADKREEAYRLFDILYLHHLPIFPDRVKGFSPEYHADITETETYHRRALIRREYQALEGIAQRAGHERPEEYFSHNYPDPISAWVRKQHILGLSLIDATLEQIPPELHQLPHLTDLFFRNTSLTTLQGMPNLPQLKRLHLDGTRLTTLQELRPLKKLEQMIIGQIQVPQQEIDELRERGIIVYT